MLKKTITYENLNGETVTEDHFFHLSKAEMIEMEMSYDGGLSVSLQHIIDTENGRELINEFKKIILRSYGKKSDDGKRFIKSQEMRESFEASEAYSALFMELATNADKATKFISGIIPSGMVEAFEQITEAGQASQQSDSVAPDPVQPSKVLTRAELEAMPADEFAALRSKLATGEVKMAD